MRRIVSSVFLLILFLFGSSLAQVRIREKVSIDPKPPQLVQSITGGLATLIVTYTNTAPLRTVDVPRFFRVFNTGCGIDVAFDPASSAVANVPVVGGTINALARFAVPAGGSGVAKITFAVNGEIIRIDSVIVNCFCTIQMNPTVFFYTGVNFAFDKGFGVHEITHGGSLGTAFANDHPFTPCSQTVWHPNLNTTFTITQGAELGAFYSASGDSIGTTVTGQQGYLAQIRYRATGEQPEGSYGTVVIQATALGNVVGSTSLTVVRSTPLVDHFSIDFEPDTVDYGSSVTVYINAEDADSNVVSLDDNTMISLEMDQSQYGRFIDEEGNEVTEVPYAYARDGWLQFTADGTNPELDTIKVVNITASAIVEGEEVTGTGEAIIKAYLTKCVAILFTPETLAPGDTAKLTFRPLDGEPFPEGQLFDLFLMSDEGILLSSDGSLAKQFKDISDSAFYIAPDSLETDSIVVRMRAQTAPPKPGGPVIVASVAMASNGGANGVPQADPTEFPLCVLNELVVKIPAIEILLGETMYFQAVKLTEGKVGFIRLPIDANGKPIRLGLARQATFSGYGTSGGRPSIYWERKWVNDETFEMANLDEDLVRVIGRFWEQGQDGKNNKSTLFAQIGNIGNILNFEVKKPATLGDVHNETKDVDNKDFKLDEELFVYAGRHGISPQILKAQIRQESNFLNAYRWEPFIDINDVHKTGSVFMRKTFRYMIIGDPLSFGEPGIPADHVNSSPPYPGVLQTIWDRFFSESRTLNPIATVNNYPIRKQDGSYVWYEEPAKRYEAYLLIGRMMAILLGFDEIQYPTEAANHWLRYVYKGGVMDEIAQTRTASSYGLLQLNYTSAVYFRKYHADSLTDSPENLPELINVASRNFELAIPFFNKKLIDELKDQGDSDSQDHGWSQGFEETIRLALNRYNGIRDERRITWYYGGAILRWSIGYQPTR